jgi:hypothetical protein
LRPPQEQTTTCMPMALTFKFPATTKTQTTRKRCNASHGIHYLTRCQSTKQQPTRVTSSIEPTINENVLPLTSTAELSITQALTYLAINQHQIYCNTQQVTSSQGHAMAREHRRRYSHHSWCLQPA